MSPHLLQSNSTAVIATTTARPHSHDNRSLINKLQLLVILNVVVVTVSFGCAAASAKLLAIKTIAQHGASQRLSLYKCCNIFLLIVSKEVSLRS